MTLKNWKCSSCVLAVSVLALLTNGARADVAFEGYLPYVGLALTDDYNTFDDSATFFIAEGFTTPIGSPLGPGSSTHYEMALLDTGAATHILTDEATQGFNIDAEGFDGTNFQPIGGATGIIDLRINDPLGVFVAGMGRRTGSGNTLTMDYPFMHGQSSFSTLSAPAAWDLPNIIGLPLAAQHGIAIRTSDPQIFEHEGRTVRTPDIEFFNLGQGVNQGILRRSPMLLNPGLGFVQGPIYVQNLDFTSLEFHENPLSPTIIENGGLFIEVDLTHTGGALEDTPFLFDTGASLTVISEQTAVRLGFDPILDEPDFSLAVEGSGGITEGIPGFFAEELKLDTVGGSFVLNNVPVAVLDVTNPNDPGNIVPGILGTNVFANRDIAIDANPSVGQGGVGPSLYISDPVTDTRVWSTTNATANWTTPTSWNASGVPDVLWDAQAINVRGSDQVATLATTSTVFRATIGGQAEAELTLTVESSGKLVTFADLVVADFGRLHLENGVVDAQFLQLDGGELSGTGDVLLGSGPLEGSLRNAGGRIAPGDPDGNVIGSLNIVGDLANLRGTLAFELAGLTPGTLHDQIEVERFAFLSGTLEVRLANAFSPSVGDSFTLIHAGTVSGSFDTLSLPNGFSWDVTYTSTEVILEITGLGLVGDFDGSGVLDCTDINLLTHAVSQSDHAFDLTGDGLVDRDDIEYWVVTLRGSVLGDANLDGVVDISDFNIWNSHRLEFNANWCDGDFSGDGTIDASDFNIWNSHKFQSGSGVVPEPHATGFGTLLGVILGWNRRRRSIDRRLGERRRDP